MSLNKVIWGLAARALTEQDLAARFRTRGDRTAALALPERLDRVDDLVPGSDPS